MDSGIVRTGVAVLAATLCVSWAPSGDPHAVAVQDFDPGAGPLFGDPILALSAPEGEGNDTGSDNVVSLGDGGSITLRLDEPMRDGPGTDLIVSENPFFVINSTDVWAEAMYVEVSSDDVDYARFPTEYVGPSATWPPFTGGRPGWFKGFAGVLPVHASSASPLIDPLDPVRAGGDAFDLAELSDDPLVTAGLVDLDDILYVRLVDVRSGVDVDDDGAVVFDGTIGGTGSADVDAITAVNNACNGGGGRPSVELTLVPGGLLTIRIEDPDGLNDVKFGLRASIDGVEIPFFALSPFFVVSTLNSTTYELVTGPVPVGQFQAVLKVSATDGNGLVRGDAVVIQ